MHQYFRNKRLKTISNDKNCWGVYVIFVCPSWMLKHSRIAKHFQYSHMAFMIHILATDTKNLTRNTSKNIEQWNHGKRSLKVQIIKFLLFLFTLRYIFGTKIVPICTVCSGEKLKFFILSILIGMSHKLQHISNLY